MSFVPIQFDLGPTTQQPQSFGSPAQFGGQMQHQLPPLGLLGGYSGYEDDRVTRMPVPGLINQPGSRISLTPLRDRLVMPPVMQQYPQMPQFGAGLLGGGERFAGTGMNPYPVPLSEMTIDQFQQMRNDPAYEGAGLAQWFRARNPNLYTHR